jgi:hypothetical protein
MGLLNLIIALALLAAGWLVIVELLAASLRDPTPHRRDVPANRRVPRHPRPGGPINHVRPNALEMSDLSQ